MGGGVVSDGVLLCLAALLLWYLSIYVNCQHISEFVYGVLSIKKGTLTEILATPQGNFVISTFGQGRFCWIMFLCTARLVLMLFLGWVGIIYIIHTQTLSDLIIKALALQAVLNVDSLIYRALVPFDASALTKKLQPLRLRDPHRVFGVDFRALFGLLIIPSVLAGVYMAMILPRVDILQEARDRLCKGNTNVLVAIDAAGMVFAAESRPKDHLTTMFHRDAVKDVINGITSGNVSSKLLWTASVSELESSYRASLAEIAQAPNRFLFGQD